MSTPDNRSKVLHKQIYKTGVFGGLVNSTLCNRRHAGNDNNVADKDQDVTCKLCLKRLATTAHT